MSRNPFCDIKVDAGFNNPAGQKHVDLLEPTDAFNIPVPGLWAAELKAELKNVDRNCASY